MEAYISEAKDEAVVRMIVDDFITAFEDPDYGKQNPFLVLASAVLELKKAGLAWDRLAPTWERMRDERRLRRGVFKRKPIHLIKDEAGHYNEP